MHYVPKSQVVLGIACMHISLPYLSSSEILLMEQLQTEGLFGRTPASQVPDFRRTANAAKSPMLHDISLHCR
jgi:hypothetical protein